MAFRAHNRKWPKTGCFPQFLLRTQFYIITKKIGPNFSVWKLHLTIAASQTIGNELYQISDVALSICSNVAPSYTVSSESIGPDHKSSERNRYCTVQYRSDDTCLLHNRIIKLISRALFFQRRPDVCTEASRWHLIRLITKLCEMNKSDVLRWLKISASLRHKFLPLLSNVSTWSDIINHLVLSDHPSPQFCDDVMQKKTFFYIRNYCK